jgi:predicted acylesterase/phospholipase RssA
VDVRVAHDETAFPSSPAALAVTTRPQQIRTSSSSLTVASSGTQASRFFTQSAHSSATNISIHATTSFIPINIDDIPFKARNGKVLVTLDGGGVRGIFSVIVLRRISQLLAARGFYLRDCVDLMGGTSTGGITTILYAWLHLPLDELVENYAKMTASLFGKPETGSWPIRPSRYSSAHQRLVYASVIDGEENSGRANLPLRIDAFNEDADIVTARFSNGPTIIPMFVVGVNALNFNEAVIMTSYGSNRLQCRTANISVVDAALATSSAPVYFTPLKYKDANGEYYMIADGGLGHNNPIDLGLNQLNELYGPQAFGDVVISIGTGLRSNKTTFYELSNRIAMTKVRRALLSMASDTEKMHYSVSDRYRNKLDGGTYHRFNIKDMGDTKLDDYKAVKSLAEASEKYLNENADELVSRLLLLH